MKKVITALFIAALVSVQAFAAEFILTPTIGYSNLGFMGEEFKEYNSGHNHRNEIFQFSSSINMMPIGIALGTVAQNGFTFLWNIDIAPIGKGTAVYDNEIEADAKLKGFAAVEQSFIFGRTFKLLNDKLYINAGSGLAAGVAKINVSKKVGEHTIFSEDSWNFNIGIPIQIGGQYFFTKNIGVNLTLADVLALGMGIGSSFHRGFENVFTLKVGPMFKF